MGLAENLEKVDSSILSLNDAYESLLKIYKRYLDLDEKYYPLVAVWVLGVLQQKVFASFPFLYLNAMKGSGKTRFLKLTSFIVNGTYTVNITEAVLFRENTPLFIDEIENIARKEKAGLRELLNVAYKRGGVVKRARKVERSGATIIESFDVYRPVCIANIEGVDDVLEDRTIKIPLEKSFNKEITRRMELFEYDPDIKKLKEVLFSVVNEGVVSVLDIEEMVKQIYYYYMYNITTLNSNTTTSTQTTPINTYLESVETLNIVNKIEKTELLGRDLELWMPLFVISSFISEDVLSALITLALEHSSDRQTQNIMENRDIVLINFLCGFSTQFVHLNIEEDRYIPISLIVKRYLEENADDIKWFNSKWVGRALNRNGLVFKRRRLSRGVEVVLDVDKIEERAKKFGINVQAVKDEWTTHETKPIKQNYGKFDRYMGSRNDDGDESDV